MADITVKNTEGATIATITANNVTEKFDVTLVGERVEDYIEDMNNNFVKLLENFAGDTAPPKAKSTGIVEGQVWYDKAKNNLNYRRSGGEWTSNANKLDGKSLDAIREYTLSGLDTTGKLSKTGGTVTGTINVNGAVEVKQTILNQVSDTVSLGEQNNRFKNVYLQEDGIRLGAESSGLTFRPHNFVYAVENDNSDVSGFPLGAIILHQETGEAIIKKSTGTFTKANSTFRKLAEDKQNSAEIGGNKFKFLGDIGLVAGGYHNSYGWYNYAGIEKINISTTGSASSFGNLSYGRSHMGNGMSSGVRGVFQGGWNGGHGNHNGNMDYVTFATPGNATYFGTFTHENYGSSSVSDGTRGVIGPGYNATGTGSTGHHQVSRYITIETPGNAMQFGTIKQGYWGSAVSSGTRGVFDGYSRNSGWDRSMEYITIQTLGNSIYFGNTGGHYGYPSAVTDAIKGVYFGGWPTYNSISYITIATPSNGTSFGNCNQQYEGAGLSNGIRGVASHSWNNTAQYVVIQTPSNAMNFGNMYVYRGARPSSASGSN